MAAAANVAKRTVGRILKQNLKANFTRKRKLYELSEKHAKQRLERVNVFKKYLSRRKLKYLFMMDKMMISTRDLDGKSMQHYRREGIVIPDAWKKLPKKN